MFSSAGGVSDKRKGWDLLQKATKEIIRSNNEFECVILGQNTLTNEQMIPVKCHLLGLLKDEYSLALLYSAVDLTVVPSRQDNLPQVALEAQACGCPVVGFSIGGLPDIVEHKRTGFLAKAFDHYELAKGIIWVISQMDRWKDLSYHSRLNAEEKWDPLVISSCYRKIYKKLLTN